jgi:glycosyltransferase involved in cell wall biosynthesis
MSEKMTQLPYKLLVGALTKNNAKYIIGVLKNIETYTSLFQDYECFFIDGDSTDGTGIILKSWAKQDAQKRSIMVESANETLSAASGRGEKLTLARQHILTHFQPQFGDNTLLLLLDTDSVNAKVVDKQGFLSCFERDDWSAVFVNQPTVYYDVWALRDSVCQGDWQIEWRLTGDVNCHKKYQARKDPSVGWWPVQSAFGGAGLYKTSALQQANPKYKCIQKWPAPNGVVYELPVCEHVPFHFDLVQAGCKLFINCKWLNCDHE